MTTPTTFRYIGKPRRVREDRRFVVGKGKYVADVAIPGALHVALVPSQHPAAKILSIDAAAALAMTGVHYVLTGDELAKAVEPMMNGLELAKRVEATSPTTKIPIATLAQRPLA